MNTSLSPSLWKAYAETVFVVFERRQEIAIRVGTLCPHVDRLLATRGVHCAAFVTAWNPRSRPWSRVANRQANQRLRAAIDRRRHRYLPGEGRPIAGDWGSEASLLVFGLTLRAATSLGRRFGQNAIVYVERGRPTRLVRSR